MKIILTDGILGMIGKGTGLLLGGSSSKLFAKSKMPGKSYYVTVAIGALAVGAASCATVHSDTTAKSSTSSPQMIKLGTELFEIPGLKERIKGKSAAETQTIIQQLTASGMLKLESSRLITRAKLIGEMLRMANVPRCARFSKGQATNEEIVSMVNALPPELQAEWLALSKEALKTEVEGKPGPKLPDESDVAIAMAKVIQQVPEAERQRFVSGITSLETLSESDACWVTRSLYTAVGKTPEPELSIVARVLVMQ